MELKLNKPIPEDTICAISTAPGMGGIAVIRISGTNAIIITDRIFHTANKKKLSEAKPNTAHYGTIADENETPIDDVVVTLFIAPHSFTGEDTVETGRFTFNNKSSAFYCEQAAAWPNRENLPVGLLPMGNLTSHKPKPWPTLSLPPRRPRIV